MRSVRWLLAMLVAAALVPAGAMAQESGTVQGTVVSAGTEAPLSGVQLSIPGTGRGTLTDAEGRYQILNVPAGQHTVQAQLIGYESDSTAVSVTAGGVATANFSLAESAVQLNEVVVTALGIEQEERAVSTSVAEIQSEEFTDVPEPNIVNALAGEVAGVSTIGAGPQGGSARIVIRGATSLSGNNQPLFVIDGVPIDNSSPDIDGYGGFDYGNAAADINPADIASVSVLKGPNAAALYGARAANGVILITTKSGQGVDGTRVTFQSSTSFTDPLQLPDYQNQYGQGYVGQFSYVDGLGSGVNDYADESWGPPCDGRMVNQFPTGEPQPFVCYPNNVASFFETGLTTYNNLAMATSFENANVRLSVGNERIDGMYPGFEQDKWNVSLNGVAQVSDRLSAEGSVNYVRREGNNRPGIGYDASNFMQQTVWFGRSVSMDKLRELYFENVDENQHVSWNPLFHTNPYWLALKNDNRDDRNRIIGNASLTYDLSDWLSVTAQTGTDWYQDDRKVTFWEDDINYPYNGFYENLINRNETNSKLFVTANRDLTPDVSLSATVGGNHRYTEDNFHFVSVDELTIPGVFTAANSARPVTVDDDLFQSAMNSLYGQAQFGYRNYAFLQITGRNDWSSTLPDENNSYFYPSVSGSFVFTDAFDLNTSILSFGKLRASWARVGNDADPYQLVATYPAQGKFGGNVPAYAVPDEIANSGLKPEQTESWEIGADLRFLNNRLGLEATYYDMVTYNQILATDISPTSGFYEKVLNAGEIANSGYELRLTATPVQLDNGFRWDVAANYANNESEVVELAEGIQSYQLGSYWQVTTEARVGDPYGSMYGIGFQRDDQGRIIVGADGLPLPTDELILLGNYSPDWMGSLSNSFSYSGIDLSFLLDTRQGGELFSVTQAFGLYTGVLQETLRGREISHTGYDVCEPGAVVDEYTGEASVTEDGSVNTELVCPNEYYKHLFNSYIREGHVYDASYVKLREARLGYTLPQSIMERTPFSGLSVALVGRNLMLWTDMPNIDPETAFDAGNSQGFEFGQIPTARSIGFNITVTP